MNCAFRCIRRALPALASLAALSLASPIGGQTPTPLTRVRTLGLDTARIGRVTAHFEPADRGWAVELASLSEHAASYFEQEFGTAFPLDLAVLRPDRWFDPYEGGDVGPYGMPWGWVPESLMTVPASLSEGVLIGGQDEAADGRRVRFVMLHELGHVASKQYLHPESGQLYSAVRWFEELVATYFAYAFVRYHDGDWTAAAQREWLGVVRANAPPSASLDWSALRRLRPEEFAATYGWYQNLLNVRVAEVHAEHGLDFLRRLRDQLNWEEAATWTTESLLPRLEEIAPGFEAWATGLEQGIYTTQPSRWGVERLAAPGRAASLSSASS